MKRTFAAPLLAALLLGAPAQAAKPKAKPKTVKPAPPPPAPPLHGTRSTEPITFIWPPEGQPMAVANEFIFGSVAVATAPFSINGTTIAVHKDGGFLAYLPVTPGTFTFRAELTLSSEIARAERSIQVALPAQALSTSTLAIDPASLSPRVDLELRAGDWLTVRMKGTPGKPARFRVGKEDWQDMRVLNSTLGLYEAQRLIAPGEEFAPALVEYELGRGWSSVKMKGKAHVGATNKAPLIASVKFSTEGYATIKTGPANGYLSFPLTGTRLPVTGREGGSLRVKLSNTVSGWIDAKDVDLSSAAPLRAVTGTINVGKTDLGAIVSIGLTDKVAFDVEPAAGIDGLTLRLYNTIGHTNWVVNDSTDFVKEIRWRQEAADTVAVTVLLKSALWGWWPGQSGGVFKLELRRAPKIASKNPFAGIKIMLDPGHMPSAPGAIGPLGTKEMDANYAIAMAAKTKLEKEGAIVLVTRNDALHEVGLLDRPKQAIDRGADLFVSLHNNAMGDGENPFGKPRGFTVFYYHPQSLELGRAMHEAYLSRIKLADEGLRWGNLLVARQSAMPAILVENAYMIIPDQEAMLNDAVFRDELGKALVEGLKNFLTSVRKRQ